MKEKSSFIHIAHKKCNKTLRIMKISVFLFFLCTFSVFSENAYSQQKEVSINLRNSTIREAFSHIEKSSDYVFLVTDDANNMLNRHVNISAENESIDEILNILLRNTDLGYRVVERQVSVYKKREQYPSSSQQNLKQESTKITVKGLVTDKHKDPLPGVSILTKGRAQGVATDATGHYILQNIDPNTTLEVSFVGMKTQVIEVKGRSIINIVLEEAKDILDEVVIIGYGSKDRKSLTSSISSLKNEDVERLAPTVPSMDALLGGAIKGVLSTQKSGAPSEGMVINVRGITSPVASGAFHQSNSPLYVIDGMPYFVEDSKLNPLLVISPNDIESIDILKDASATAIYGSRGANGVIIVKTKNGRKGEKMTINAGYTFSAANPIKEHMPLNIAEYKQLQDLIIKGTTNYISTQQNGILSNDMYEALNYFGNIRANYNPDLWSYELLGYDGLRESAFGATFTDWTDRVKNKNAVAHQYFVSLRGGSETTNYSASINALNQEGVAINDDFNRYGIRFSLDTDINSRISTGSFVSYSVTTRKYGGTHDEMFAVEPYPWRMRPDVPVYDAGGSFARYRDIAYGTTEALLPNPLAMRSRDNKFGAQQILTSGYIDVNIMDGLKAHADINLSSFMFNTIAFNPSYSIGIFDGMQSEASIFENSSKSTSIALNIRLDYTKKIGQHHIAAMTGIGRERSYYGMRSAYSENFFNESVLNNIGSASTIKSLKDNYSKGGLNSTYARLSYDYAYRYLMELSFRSDVSSKFGPGNRVASFPAVSSGWRVNNESFMESITGIDDLKLRTSLGKTGSANVGDFSFMRFYSKKGKYAGNPAVTVETTFPNVNVGWEKTTEYNGGIDFSFFNRRLFGSIDIYNRLTKGALSTSPFIMESGYEIFSSNLIDMVNKGFEFEIGSEIIRSNNFSWVSSFNISSNENKVQKLNGANLSSTQQDVIIEGQPIGVIKGYRVKEIVSKQSIIDQLNAAAISKGHREYQSDLGIGDYLIEDVNNDGHITPEDRTVLGSPEPKLFGGWNNVLLYKNLSLSFLMQFSLGGKAIYSDIRSDLFSTIGASITREVFGKTWTPENMDARYPRMVASRYVGYNFRETDRNIFKTSYMRMKNITLSYNLDTKVTTLLGVNKVSIFTSVSNLFTLTHWPGLDPELLGSNMYAGNSKEDPYPLSRTISIGFNLQF